MPKVLEKVLKGHLEFPSSSSSSGFYISLLKVRGHVGLKDSQNVPLVNMLNVTAVKNDIPLSESLSSGKVLVQMLAGPLMQPLSQAVLWDPFFPVAILQKNTGNSKQTSPDASGI